MGLDELDISEYINPEYLEDHKTSRAESDEPQVQRYGRLTPAADGEAGASQR